MRSTAWPTASWPTSRPARRASTSSATCRPARRRARRQCLSAPQKTALANVFAGARNSAGKPIYASFPFDAGIGGSNWREWKFASPPTRDAGAVRLHLRDAAAGRPARRHWPSRWASTWTATRRASTPPTPRLPRIGDGLHDAARRRQPGGAARPRRQDDGLPRHQRPGVLVATTRPPGTSGVQAANGGDAAASRATSRCPA